MLLVKRLESQLIPKPLRASTGFQYEFLLLNVLSVQIQIISLSTRFPKIPNSAFDDIKLPVVVLATYHLMLKPQPINVTEIPLTDVNTTTNQYG